MSAQDLKSKKIVSLSNELENIDRDIDTANKLVEMPLACIKIYNGSSEVYELSVWKNLKAPLKDFLIDFFNKEKIIIYNQLNKQLKS